MGQEITETNFSFPGQTAVYHGKVRDVYTINNKYMVSVASDRISAFDVILPRPIPCKGQVLNQIADYFLQATADVVPNWLLSAPDPNASIGHRAEPFKIEMVIRGCLVGYSWRAYQAGKRELCGEPMPDGLKEYDAFPEPIITPSTKADEGHDEDISAAEILVQGLATKEEWKELCRLSRALFAKGQAMAKERGLFLADTKYEFGKLDGKIILIDEVHTPDSSRYFYLDGYQAYISGKTKEPPKHLSKEFVREWLIAKGFQGQAGKAAPKMDNEFVKSVSERYIELFQELTGQKFVAPPAGDPLKRIEKNVLTALEKL